MGMGKDSAGVKGQEKPLETFTWTQIKNKDKENKKKLIVIDNVVYDVANFYKKHPGGIRIMLNHIGEDVTDAFAAFHTDKKKVSKYLDAYRVGELEPNERDKQNADGGIMADFRALRVTAEKMGCFEANLTFYVAHFTHIVLLIAAAWFLINTYQNWYGYFAAVACLVISQAQAGWLQHDLGHLSVFKSNKMNHFMHHVVISLIKGVSSDWWNFGHFQHHSKPNVKGKDPDISLGKFFVLGKIFPKELGEQKKGEYPYQHQQNYFCLLVPPLLAPLYFNYSITHFMVKKRLYGEMLWVATFWAVWMYLFAPALGAFGVVKLFFLVRFFESHWFVWVTQMSHIPMEIDHEKYLDWFRMQLHSTCNVHQSTFNDWFTGHLNFQIEHHLFPTMPRHNCHKIAPLVKSLCAKYNVAYVEKPLSTALADVYRALKQSGQIWYEAYNKL